MILNGIHDRSRRRAGDGHAHEAGERDPGFDATPARFGEVPIWIGEIATIDFKDFDFFKNCIGNRHRHPVIQVGLSEIRYCQSRNLTNREVVAIRHNLRISPSGDDRHFVFAQQGHQSGLEFVLAREIVHPEDHIAPHEIGDHVDSPNLVGKRWCHFLGQRVVEKVHDRRAHADEGDSLRAVFKIFWLGHCCSKEKGPLRAPRLPQWQERFLG